MNIESNDIGVLNIASANALKNICENILKLSDAEIIEKIEYFDIQMYGDRCYVNVRNITESLFNRLMDKEIDSPITISLNKNGDD